MFKKVALLSVIGLTCTLPNTVSANNFSYNFFEFRTAMSPESYGLEYSQHFTENSHFIVRADSRFKNDWDIAGGIGFNGPISQFADLYGQIMLHHIRFSDKEDKDSDSTFEINLGTRVWLTNQIEGHVKVGRADDNSVFIAGIRFHSTEQLSLSAEARNSGVWGPQIAMGVRFNY